MLLELIPPSQALPSFRLYLDFPDFTHGHPNPLAWSTQLSSLLQHELDLPRSMHMLDRAVGLTTLIESVRFDLRNARSDNSEGPGLTNIRCEFVDGGVIDWAVPLNFSNNDNVSGKNLSPFLKVLQSILNDVHAMRLEEERAKLALQLEQQVHDQQNQASASSSVGPSLGLAKRFSVSVMRHSSSMPSMSGDHVITTRSHKRQKSFLQSIVSAVG